MMTNFERHIPVDERMQLHCNDCSRTTIHNLEARVSGSWSDADQQFSAGETYSILRCGACDAICFTTVSWNSEEYDHDEHGDTLPVYLRKQYPIPNASYAFNTEFTPHAINKSLRELLTVFSAQQYLSSTVMLRIVLEQIIKSEKVAGSDLKKKIGDMKKNNMIDDDQESLLHRIRLFGNLSAHEAKPMKPQEILAGMKIVNGLLDKFYNNPGKHADVIATGKDTFGS